jgi:hypothetical protein
MDAEQALQIWIKLGLMSEDKVAAARAALQEPGTDKAPKGANPMSLANPPADLSSHNPPGANGDNPGMILQGNREASRSTDQSRQTNAEVGDRTVAPTRVQRQGPDPGDKAPERDAAGAEISREIQEVQELRPANQTRTITHSGKAGSLQLEPSVARAGNWPGQNVQTADMQQLQQDASRIAGTLVKLNEAIKIVQTAGREFETFSSQVAQLGNAMAAFRLEDITRQVAGMEREIEQLKQNLGRTGQ